jgi:hypothetical protein
VRHARHRFHTGWNLRPENPRKLCAVQDHTA